MRRSPFLALIARVLLALALIAPHGAAAAVRDDGLTIVICGAAGSYEITLGDAPTAPHAAPHDCCVVCVQGLAPPSSAFSVALVASPCASRLAPAAPPARSVLGPASPRGPPPSA